MERLTLEQLKERADKGTLIGAFLVSNDDYHAGPALSSTDIKKIHKDPAKWKCDKMAGIKLSSPALEFGSLYHASALEYPEFDNRYAITQLARKGSKAWEKEETAALEAGKILVKQADIDLVNAMLTRITGAAGIKAHSKRGLLLGQIETSFYWTDMETGLLLKTRPDVLTESGHAVDLKTTRCGDNEKLRKTPQEVQEELSRDILLFGYHVSAAMQLEGVREATKQGGCEKEVVAVPKDYVLFFQNKVAPFNVYVRLLDQSSLDLGANVLQTTLRIYKEIEDNNAWDKLEQEMIAKEDIPQDTNEDIKIIGVGVTGE